MINLPHATSRERLKLIWKTTARSVHVFMENLPAEIQDCNSTLWKALREEYSLYTNEVSATLSTFAIFKKKHESPQDYHRRLRTAYFQGCNALGLEEDRTFKCSFLHNLHESLCYNVIMHCRTHGISTQDTRNFKQLAWETRRHLTERREGDARILG